MKPVECFLFPRCCSMPSLVLAFRPRSCRSGMDAYECYRRQAGSFKRNAGARLNFSCWYIKSKNRFCQYRISIKELFCSFLQIALTKIIKSSASKPQQFIWGYSLYDILPHYTCLLSLRKGKKNSMEKFLSLYSLGFKNYCKMHCKKHMCTFSCMLACK